MQVCGAHDRSAVKNFSTAFFIIRMTLLHAFAAGDRKNAVIWGEIET